MDLNQIYVEGRLTKAPEIKICKDGETYFFKCCIACNRFEKINNEFNQKATFFNIKTFLSKDDFLLNNLTKGDLILVRGSMIQEDNISVSTGKKYTNWILQAKTIRKVQQANIKRFVNNYQTNTSSPISGKQIDEIYNSKKAGFFQDEIPF